MTFLEGYENYKKQVELYEKYNFYSILKESSKNDEEFDDTDDSNFEDDQYEEYYKDTINDNFRLNPRNVEETDDMNFDGWVPKTYARGHWLANAVKKDKYADENDPVRIKKFYKMVKEIVDRLVGPKGSKVKECPIKPGDIIIPAYNHGGKAEYTKQIVTCIINDLNEYDIDCFDVDCLTTDEHQSEKQHTALAGARGDLGNLDDIKVDMTDLTNLDPSTNIWIFDNVATKGKTYNNIVYALRDAGVPHENKIIPLFYTISNYTKAFYDADENAYLVERRDEIPVEETDYVVDICDVNGTKSKQRFVNIGKAEGKLSKSGKTWHVHSSNSWRATWVPKEYGRVCRGPDGEDDLYILDTIAYKFQGKLAAKGQLTANLTDLPVSVADQMPFYRGYNKDTKWIPYHTQIKTQFDNRKKFWADQEKKQKEEQEQAQQLAKRKLEYNDELAQMTKDIEADPRITAFKNKYNMSQYYFIISNPSLYNKNLSSTQTFHKLFSTNDYTILPPCATETIDETNTNENDIEEALLAKDKTMARYKQYLSVGAKNYFAEHPKARQWSPDNFNVDEFMKKAMEIDEFLKEKTQYLTKKYPLMGSVMPFNIKSILTSKRTTESLVDQFFEDIESFGIRID